MMYSTTTRPQVQDQACICACVYTITWRQAHDSLMTVDTHYPRKPLHRTPYTRAHRAVRKAEREIREDSQLHPNPHPQEHSSLSRTSPPLHASSSRPLGAVLREDTHTIPIHVCRCTSDTLRTSLFVAPLASFSIYEYSMPRVYSRIRRIAVDNPHRPIASYSVHWRRLCSCIASKQTTQHQYLHSNRSSCCA